MMKNRRFLKLLILAFVIFSVLTWGAIFLHTASGNGLSKANIFIRSWALVAYFTFIPWIITLFFLIFRIVTTLRNDAIKFGVGILMIPLFLIIGFNGIWVGSLALISIKLKLDAPIAHYLKSQASGQSIDVSKFFEKSAAKSEVFAILSEQKFTRGIRSNEDYDQWYEEALAKDPPIFEYGFRRSVTCIPTVAHRGIKLRLEFDENEKLISATGSGSECNM